MVDVGARAKVTITAGNGRGEFYVGRNHEYNDRTEDGLYLTLFDYKGTFAYQAFDVADIPALIEALQSVADDFEALKANEPKQVSDITDALPNGTIMHFDDEPSQFVKVAGRWHYLDSATPYYDPQFRNGTWSLENWTVNVDYNPEEAN